MPSKHMRARGIFRLEAATLDTGDRDGCDREDGGGGTPSPGWFDLG